MLVSFATLVLYCLDKFNVLDVYTSAIAISDLSLIMGIGVFLVCFLAYAWPSKSDTKPIHGATGSNNRKIANGARHDEQAAEQADVVINAIDDGVISLDGQGNITLINPAAQKLIGWTGGDAIGLNYRSVLRLVDSKDVPVSDADDTVRVTLNTNTSTETDNFSLITGSGKRRMVSLVASPVGETGSGAIIVFRDITKTKAEEREQGEFISTASHEMRTPVASIEGYLGLALNPHTATVDEKAREFIEKAHASAQHLGRLFQDLLDVSRADDGRLSNHPKAIDVVDFVGTVVEGLKPKADEKDLQLTYVPRPFASQSGPKVVAPVYYANVDNDHLREVVSNLVENAIKYTLHGTVSIDIAGDETHISISVKDSGIGIPAEDIPHLFQKFYRVDNSDTREIGGTGLGLYLCRRLAEVMGGRIDLQSEFKKGSVFTLQLPRIERNEALELIETQSKAAAAEVARQAAEASKTPPVEPSVLMPAELTTTPAGNDLSVPPSAFSSPAVATIPITTPTVSGAVELSSISKRSEPEITVPSRSNVQQKPPGI